MKNLLKVSDCGPGTGRLLSQPLFPRLLQHCVLPPAYMSFRSSRPFEVEPHPNNIQELNPYLKENTTVHHYKAQLVNSV
jgi:hypothetical protein